MSLPLSAEDLRGARLRILHRRQSGAAAKLGRNPPMKYP